MPNIVLDNNDLFGTQYRYYCATDIVQGKSIDPQYFESLTQREEVDQAIESNSKLLTAGAISVMVLDYYVLKPTRKSLIQNSLNFNFIKAIKNPKLLLNRLKDLAGVPQAVKQKAVAIYNAAVANPRKFTLFVCYQVHQVMMEILGSQVEKTWGFSMKDINLANSGFKNPSKND